MTESDEFTDLHQERLERATDIASYQLPELPEAEAAEVYERIVEAERRLATPDLSWRGYDEGVAAVDDEIGVSEGSAGLLLTTEHATSHLRRAPGTDARDRKRPDRGTAALGWLLHEELGAHHLTMLGRQTMDANHDKVHPFKDEISRVMTEHEITRGCSIHGMAGGKFSDFSDERAYDVLVGVGKKPNAASLDLAATIERVAGDLGLRAATNDRIIKVASNDPLVPELNADGSVAFTEYFGSYRTTRAHMIKVGRDQGKEVAVVQIELADLLRFLPLNLERDQHTRQMGAYLGYLLLKRSFESLS